MDESRAIEVCKRGQGADCCRYLAFGGGWRCAKLDFDGLRPIIEKRTAEGTMSAKADLCPGIPFDD